MCIYVVKAAVICNIINSICLLYLVLQYVSYIVGVACFPFITTVY